MRTAAGIPRQHDAYVPEAEGEHRGRAGTGWREQEEEQDAEDPELAQLE